MTKDKQQDVAAFCEHLAGKASSTDDIGDAADFLDAKMRLEALLVENERFVEALTPSGDTKAAYHGEFSFTTGDGLSDEGEELFRKVYVPWTTVKEIMAAIKARTLLGDS